VRLASHLHIVPRLMRGNIRARPDTRQEGGAEVSKHSDKFTFVLFFPPHVL